MSETIPEAHSAFASDHAAREEKTAAFLGELMGGWYECAPYGEQVPRDLPQLLVAFVGSQGKTIDRDGAWEIIDSPADEAWLPMFESIFTEGARYALMIMDNAVYDSDADKLSHIGLDIEKVRKEAEAPVRKAAEIWERRANEAEEQLRTIEEWNAASVETSFDKHLDAAMKILRNRREKHEIADVIAKGLREAGNYRTALETLKKQILKPDRYTVGLNLAVINEAIAGKEGA